MARGIVETPLHERARVEYESLGVTIELPVQPANASAKYYSEECTSAVFQKNSGCKAELDVFMYPARSGQPLAEPEFCLVFGFNRLSSSQFDEFKQGKHYLNQDRSLGNPSEFQPTLLERTFQRPVESRKYRCFRKDIRLPDGDFVVATACLNEAVIDAPFVHLDTNDIRAILESVVPLPVVSP